MKVKNRAVEGEMPHTKRRDKMVESGPESNCGVAN